MIRYHRCLGHNLCRWASAVVNENRRLAPQPHLNAIGARNKSDENTQNFAHHPFRKQRGGESEVNPWIYQLGFMEDEIPKGGGVRGESLDLLKTNYR